MQRSTEQLTTCSTATATQESVENGTGIIATRTVSEKIMTVCKKSISPVFLLDIFLALSVTVLTGVLEFAVLPHQAIGFFCNDPKISFKFMGDTISLILLLSFSFFVPIIMMWVTEYACHSANCYDTVLGRNFRLRQVWIWYRHYAVGIIMLMFICNVMKVLIGEPRPHFLDTCKPREAMNCTNEYISSYTCTNTEYSLWFISDSSRSFPSGHSAFSVYTSIFMVWYLQNRLATPMWFLKPWLQGLLSLWVVTCSMTRVADNRHHWWDVVAGIVLGFLFVLFVVIVPCRHFHLEHVNVTHAFNEPVENGQVGYTDKQQQGIKNLLTTSGLVEVTEGREMRDITTNWHE